MSNRTDRGGLSRRGFLKGAGVAAATTALLDRSVEALAQENKESRSVLGPGAVLRVATAETGRTVAAWGNRAGNDALAFAIALHGGAKLFDDAHWLVPDGQASRHRILALENVDVRSADGGGRDTDQRIERAHVRNGLLVQHDASGLDEDGGFHLGHECSPGSWIMDLSA